MHLAGSARGLHLSAMKHCISDFWFLVQEDERKEGRRVRSAYLCSFCSHCTARGLHPSTRGPSPRHAALFSWFHFLVLRLVFSPCPF
ncbi:hypothetical protein Cadr_000014045 [Camelus dromedarius]|uniref:Uncharacterized protein n=1 Tax=Camelus dromedarius TaxID=9838 RepID=A0A5N4DEJ7_CAMDR|nr:hypothetical protein Cadr_000014045 [Camelus dromedarius]